MNEKELRVVIDHRIVKRRDIDPGLSQSPEDALNLILCHDYLTVDYCSLVGCGLSILRVGTACTAERPNAGPRLNPAGTFHALSM